MKLTPELLAVSPPALNPLKERQLDLRGAPFFDTDIWDPLWSDTFCLGHKIPAIENLGVTKVRLLR